MKLFSRLRQWFGLARSAGVALLVVLLGLRIWDPAPLEAVRLNMFDYYQAIKPRESALRPVVIVDIDEESLRAIGQWPWPRTLVADMVAQLTKLGALVIGFDIIFAEPDRMSPREAAASFRDVDEETKAKLRRLPSNDSVLAEALKSSRVVLGQSGFHRPTAGKDAAEVPRTGFALMGSDPSRYLVTFPGLLRNVPALEQAAAGHGLLTIRPERDGIVRRTPMVMKAQNTIVPALTLEMLRVVTGSPVIRVKTDAAGIQSIAVPGLEMPTDMNGQLRIYFDKHDPARYISAKDLIEGRVPRDRIERKLVLVGTSAVGLLDLKTTPLEAAMPGVEIQAQILENALTHAALSYPNYSIVIELAAALLTSIAIIVLAPIMAAPALFVLGAGVAAALIATSWFFFARQGVLLDFTFPLLASFVIYLTLVFINYFREQIERRRIRSAFSQYLSPALVEQLAKSHDKLVLGGEERDMTIMFSDVRGFTTISELYKHDPQGLTHLMNRFLTPLTNAIIGQKGTIDKYMGDAIMAFWNAPLDDPSHEINACAAALEMLRRVDDLNREREQEARASGQRFIPIHIGVGINTGQCVVGNMGSDLRFDYSVLGDSVNLASRLEGRSKAYGTPIIVGAKTAKAAQGKFAMLEIDLITVKGKTEPEMIFTILGDRDTAESAEFQELHGLTAKMLSCYRKRDWAAALETAQLCKRSHNSFALAEVYELYQQRIHSFQQTPPPSDWDGVFAFDTK
jgi:adenylate cyclase